MFKISFTTLAMVIIPHFAFAEVFTENYTSIATGKDGKISYQERHKAEFTDRRISSATTEYLDADGKTIGRISSDFSQLITTPSYNYKDLRTGASHGIRFEGESITLWKKDNEKSPEKSALFNKDQFEKEALIVGCQGLHYYLIDNLDAVKTKKFIPVVYLMPGKLDYYRFNLKLEKEDEKYIYLKLSIDNFILKMFTSSLELKYSKADNRLMQYSGLSNITNDKDEMQYVKIDYSYNEVK